ncbi:MAG: TonB-dependent receptor domain-containing protein, partial [Burkholderiaceae bacterium]
SWGRGFRAPSLPEISPSIATFFTAVNDPLFPLNPPTNVSGSFAGNPNLQPEKSRSTTAGIVWEPSNAFSLGVDYYEITWSNIVVGDCCQDIVDTNDPTRVIRDPQTNQIVTVFGNYLNLPRTETKGFDFDTRYVARTTFGRFTGRLNATYVAKFEEDGVEYVGTNGGTNTYPRWKGYISLDWDQGPWAVTGRVNYIHHYYQQLLAASFFTPQDPRFQNGTYPEKVPSYTTLDLYARYNITTNLSVNGAILNVTDEVPPYDPGFDPTGLYDFSQYDVRGIQFRIGVNYKFR